MLLCGHTWMIRQTVFFRTGFMVVVAVDLCKTGSFVQEQMQTHHFICLWMKVLLYRFVFDLFQETSRSVLFYWHLTVNQQLFKHIKNKQSQFHRTDLRLWEVFVVTCSMETSCFGQIFRWWIWNIYVHELTEFQFIELFFYFLLSLLSFLFCVVSLLALLTSAVL